VQKKSQKMDLSGSENSRQLQVRFVSTQKLPVDLPLASIALPDETTPAQLNSMLVALIPAKCPPFQFYIENELVKENLRDHLKNSSIETEIQIECVVQKSAPQPESAFAHPDWISVIESKGNRILSGCYDSTVRLWDRHSGELLTETEAHAGPVKCLAFVDEDAGEFVTGGQDQTVGFWHLKGKSIEPLRTGKGHESIEPLRIGKGHESIEPLRIGKGHERSVESLVARKDQRKCASGGFDGLLKIWNFDAEPSEKKQKADTGAAVVTPMVTLDGHKESVSGLTWRREAEELTSVSFDHTMRIWDLTIPGMKHQMVGTKAFTCVAGSPHTHLLLTGSSDKFVRGWDPRSREGSVVKSIYASHNGWVVDISWSPNDDRQFVSASYDGLVKFWDVRSFNAPLFDLRGHQDRAFCVDWSVSDLICSGGADCFMHTYKI